MATSDSTENQAYIAELRETVDKKVSDLLTDNDCMRFVRARKTNIKKAAEMATAWAEWWQTPFDIEDMSHMSPSNILKTQPEDPTEELYTELVHLCRHIFISSQT